MALTIDVLGPVTVAADGVPVPLPRPRERAVLALLALAHPTPVGVERVVGTLWGDAGGGSAQTVRSYVSRLRHVIGPDVLQSTPAGYALAVQPDALDTARADRLLATAAAALQAGNAEAALTAAEDALALWRGTPYAELVDPAADIARARLDRLRRTGVATLARALLGVGRPARAVEVLTPACTDAPFEEPLWALLIHALHADGHRDEALRRHDEIRRALSTELGIDPGEEVRAAHAALLAPAAVSTPRGRMPIRYAPRDGRSICHAVLGSTGPPLLLLHGMFMPSEMLAEEPAAAAFLERLAARHRLVVMDLGGLGLSDAVPPEVLSFEGWAADAAAVLDHIGVTAARVIGCGPSTAVALHLADQRPDLVSRLVLAGVPLRGAWGDERLEELLDHIDGHQRGPDAVGYLAPSRRGDTAFTDWLDRGGERGATPAVARAFFRLLFSADLGDLVARTAVPTLVIDRPDALGNGRHTAEVMSLLQDGHIVVQPDLPDVLPFVGGVDGWVDAALGFLDGDRPPPPSRLMAVAVTAEIGGTPVITVHDLPDQAVEAAEARAAQTDGPCRSVVHAGIVAPGSPPAGPAVAQALDALATAASGAVTRTRLFDALDQDGVRHAPHRVEVHG